MTITKKVSKVKKSVRLSPATVTLIEKESKKSGKRFSETMRRAVTKGLERSVKAKNK